MFKSRWKALAAVGSGVVAAITMAVPALADTAALQTAVGTGMTSASTDLIAVLTTNAPVLIGVAVAMLIVSFGIRLVKKMGH